MNENIIFLVNVVNIIIAAALFLVSFNTYRTYKLKIFKNAWSILAIGSMLWLIGHVLMIIGGTGMVHYILFTLFIILLTLALHMLSKTAKTLGV